MSETALPVSLDRASPEPLAVQLADALRAAAADGRLRSGDRLPSTRALAERLGVSRTVTAAAYEQLHAEGWIAGRHGSGTYVTTTPPGSLRTPARRSAPAAPAPEVVDLAPGAPWAGGLDRAAWRRAWRAAADALPLFRPQRGGLPEYRAVVAEHLLRHRGLAVRGGLNEELVLATGGTTAALVELGAAVFEPGDVVAVEEPGYQRAVWALRAAGLRVVPAPVDEEGMLVDAVPRGVRGVYCSPAHQYPMGGRMSAGRRVALVERARRDGWLVVEDDYDGELRYDVAPLPLLAALAPDVVVHLGTTSKILTPTLGAGWMVAPEPVAAAVLAHRDRTGTGPAPAGQRVLVELARNGDLGRHLRRLRRELSERRALVAEALSAAGLRVLGDDAGAHVVVPLPTARAERDLLAAAEARGLRVDGLARHHAGRPKVHGVAIGYGACSREQLAAALPVLVELLTTRGAREGGPGGSPCR
ncbi:MocR-like pyridoxine biosynthesis transcription factor PdxR [Saccharothrix coeruleofusca]|uniref:GntR family transcriptional regulator n=1 Tax=Saccharothrix coeruleofusca TaxID=33919 RepID=A0A918AK35_9PSEU|nr:PLP-dependent aminotransferase family protein [Saccharothrix coeruleofusca]MBP2338602.1 GntR family transcriptional regulator/MocR family aminotransferase [Saccharothrix coeruleofusca]GGP47276.1 GntR family transcriptional regulator [Saccharothrix coeruleofusca]